jgi:ketosteroid isomerase-like protein
MTGAAQPVGELCRAISARDFAAVEARLAADATWTIVGRPDRFPFGGPQTKPQFIEGLKASLPGFTEFRFDVLTWAQNGEVVFVEAQGEGRGPGEARYSNRYLIRFVVHDGLIVQALEHYDPFEALAYVEQLPG